jgi:2-oxoisovalerate dehydrogenase E1 component
MPSVKPITTDTPWYRLEVGEEDWKTEDSLLLVRLYEQLLLIRRFEEKLLELHGLGLIHGPAHVSIGQEAGAVGAMSVLSSGDRINGTHRAHHQLLAKLLNYATPAGYDARRDAFTPDMREMVTRSMAEIMGLTPGFAGGRGGSMHMRYDAAGIPGTSAIIGGNLPHAAGYAFADKVRRTANISVSFFGDGTLMAGATHEAMNLAALYTLPVIFFLENNYYAVSTTVSEQTRETRLTSRGPMLGIPAIEVDGMDMIAVRRAMQDARRIIETRGGPVMIEAQCYRFAHQTGGRPGSDFGYRTKEEEALWRTRDPLETVPRRLQELGALDAAGAERLDAKVGAVLAGAVAELTEMAPGANALSVKPALWPKRESVDDGIRGDLSEFKNERFRELEDYAAAELAEGKFVTAMSDALTRNMERDPTIVVLGEDIHRLKGGVSGATRGALERFPERIFATPIAENGFVGLALGAAICGLRPICEIMFGDFCIPAADQLFNQVAKIRHMFGGKFDVPLVVRVRVSPSAGFGSQHSMDPSGLFALYPGWRIVAPSTPFDYLGLMNSAIRCNDPVMIVEHAELFQSAGLMPTNDLDYCIPLGKAKVVRPGSDCTVLAAATMVKAATDAAEATGIDAEVIDLRSLDPTGLDWPCIETSVKRTNRIVVAEQTARGTSIGARIVAELQTRVFDYLDHEIVRVTGGLAAPVVSKVLNQAALAGQAEVARGLRAVMGMA